MQLDVPFAQYTPASSTRLRRHRGVGVLLGLRNRMRRPAPARDGRTLDIGPQATPDGYLDFLLAMPVPLDEVRR